MVQSKMRIIYIQVYLGSFCYHISALSTVSATIAGRRMALELITQYQVFRKIYVIAVFDQQVHKLLRLRLIAQGQFAVYFCNKQRLTFIFYLEKLVYIKSCANQNTETNKDYCKSQVRKLYECHYLQLQQMGRTCWPDISSNDLLFCKIAK